MADQVESAGGGEQAGGASAAKQAVRRIVDALTERQRRAITLVSEGKSIEEIAMAIGVDRGTIYRWLRNDPHFRAAYNMWQLRQRESCQAALLRCADTAVAKIVHMVNLDTRVAWRLVKEMGMLTRAQPLQIDPLRVEREIAIEQLEADAILTRREPPPPKQANPADSSQTPRPLLADASPAAMTAPGPTPALAPIEPPAASPESQTQGDENLVAHR